jgi:hypothetical protein
MFQKFVEKRCMMTMKHEQNFRLRNGDVPVAVLEVDIKNVYSGSDYACLEHADRDHGWRRQRSARKACYLRTLVRSKRRPLLTR